MIGIIPEIIGAFDPTLVHDLVHDNTDQWWNNVAENFRFYRHFCTTTGPVGLVLSLDQISNLINDWSTTIKLGFYWQLLIKTKILDNLNLVHR